jgi:hypothetical protein
MKSMFGILVAAAIGAGLVWFLRPAKQVVIPVPQIVTVYDTVAGPVDTLFLRGPKVVTTDTVTLVEHVTLHDTVQIPVMEPDTAKRPNLWPILSLEVGKARGDTTRLATFSLRSGKSATSLVWTPGPLQGAFSDSTPTPRLNFFPPPVCGVSLRQNLKAGVVGAAAYELGRLLLGKP